MTKLCCVDYGFECNFAVDANDSSDMIQEFAKHTADRHGIEYSAEALMQFIIRKGNTEFSRL